MCQHTLLYLSCILRKIRVLVISQFSSHSWGNDAFCVLWFILGMQSFEHVFFCGKTLKNLEVKARWRGILWVQEGKGKSFFLFQDRFDIVSTKSASCLLVKHSKLICTLTQLCLCMFASQQWQGWHYLSFVSLLRQFELLQLKCLVKQFFCYREFYLKAKQLHICVFPLLP